MERLGKIEIHVRDRETISRLVEKGITQLVSRELLLDYYVQSVDVYQEELIIYLGDKHGANIAKLKDPAWASGIYPLKLPKDAK